MKGDLDFDPISIDVGSIAQRSVASLYSYLVTRPTGRAVRSAIEGQLAGAGSVAVSLIDLSEVTVIDFSCADEVVAKLLLRYHDAPSPVALFLFRGVDGPHRDAIETVLLRHSLAAVAETGHGSFELIGDRSQAENDVWHLLEARKRIGAGELGALLPSADRRGILDRLVRRRVVYRGATSGDYLALSALVEDLI